LKKHVEITFLPQRKSVKLPEGALLLQATQQAFIDTEALCNGKGTCGKCRIQHIAGDVSAIHQDERAHLNEEEIASGVRLACRTTATGDGSFRVLNDARREHRILSDGFMPRFDFDPSIRKTCIDLPPPSLDDTIDDLGRLERAIGRSLGQGLSLALLSKLPEALKAGKYTITLVFSGDILIGVEPGDTTGQCYGVAVDIGTTTVVAALVDLVTGEEVATASMINPQKDYGLDVLTRIHALKENPDGPALLSRSIREGINALIGDLGRTSGIDSSTFYEIAVAANTTMMHLFLGVDATKLGRSPYVPVFVSAQTIPARELEIAIAEFGLVYCLPSVSGYIGADIVAGLLTTELHARDKQALFIDIGTNGELVLGCKDGLSACSCAAGPALEGMNIRCGMRAAEGAIERVSIDNDIVRVETIGNQPPVGICGSGIIDAVAELLKAGAIMESGRLTQLKNGQGKSFVLWKSRNGTQREIEITQKDIRQVQLAKGAIRSGIVALANRLDVELADLDTLYIAGAFGHHIRMESLARLGVIPSACAEKVVLVGNSSKTGAMLCLLSREKRREASHIASQVRYVELSCYPEFDRLFADCLAFKEGA
jgi:uncharacterized 2Fe-2S/4Fe-4S cluster protein (DUF4445 family)